jgi:hypothetical protein
VTDAAGLQVVAILALLFALVRVLRPRRSEPAPKALPPWSGADPLPAPYYCPTSTSLLEVSGGLQLVSLDEGWVPGDASTFAWTAAIRQPPEALGSVRLRVVLVDRDDEHLPAGDGMGNFFTDSRQVEASQAATLVATLRRRLTPDDSVGLNWVTATAPIDRLPAGKPGVLVRARARLEVTTSEGRRLVATTPFAYAPRAGPIGLVAATPDDATCPVCGDALGDRPRRTCERCDTLHHEDCYDYLGDCATFGCRP